MKKLFILRSAALAASLMTMSFASFATETTSWNFRTYNGNDYGTGTGTNSYGNTLNFSSSDTNLSVTAWADTNEISGPDTIETATAANNSYGLLNYNRNNDLHYVDNSTDTDMLLFSFDDFVNISEINIGYIGRYGNGSLAGSDISIAAFSDVPTLSGSTWKEVSEATNLLYSANFASLNEGTNNINVDSEIEARYWLIGAYNSNFGDTFNFQKDYLKIAGITTIAGTGPDPKPPTDVAEPSSLAVLASFGLFAVWRRRKTA
ncbi:MAG: exosortase-dependent surface protein XDP1 [Paraglaciecola polaris]|uniref:exosortase-dependent surface protein XDP1 n=1 Tax=Paraglaciecola polaris TaxID=222814 RepID=UPI003001EAC6|tara:strand:+ start:336 stop:1121 length:786 start_codon:yes stop_codon:yes gene_type:complete